jgi:GNAT superfamily N-acetyltransferase
MGKTIFRKIGGRIIPIRLTGAPRPPFLSSAAAREMVAKVGDDVIGGIVFARKALKPSAIKVKLIDVNSEFQGHGIGTALFERLIKLAKKIKVTEIEGGPLIDPGAVKIRAKFASKFFTGKKEITAKQAIQIIEKHKIRQIARAKKGLMLLDPPRVRTITKIPRIKK